MLRRQPDAVMLRQLLMHYYAISHYAIRDSGYLQRPTVAVFWYLGTVKWILIYYDVSFIFAIYRCSGICLYGYQRFCLFFFLVSHCAVPL